MDLIDFDCPIDVIPGRRVVVSTSIPAPIQETVVVRPSAATAYLAKPTEDWSPAELRDYVVHQIETRHGPFPRDEVKEMAIFKSFASRWPEQRAQAIARFAFEIAGGYWKGSPIKITRFCKASDTYFAAEIDKRLQAAQANT